MDSYTGDVVHVDFNCLFEKVGIRFLPIWQLLVDVYIGKNVGNT